MEDSLFVIAFQIFKPHTTFLGCEGASCYFPSPEFQSIHIASGNYVRTLSSLTTIYMWNVI
jgi:hypothetical protein